MSDQQRPYAGQSWRKGMISGRFAVIGLQIIAKDLRDAAETEGITEADSLELWENDTTKGLFVGDTSSLVADGWTKLATL